MALALTVALSSPAQVPTVAATEHRSISVTVDDVPGMNATDMRAADVTAMNASLLRHLEAAKVPAAGFVNESKLYQTGEVDARIAVLSAWLKAGMDLGNHTYSHDSLNSTPLHDWEDDVIQGENVTRWLLEAQHRKLRYFRHPYLDVGPDLRTRREAEAFLAQRGYRVAPVTIDPLDWYFADLYGDARSRGDHALQTRLTEAWLTYAGQVFAYEEQQSRSLLGYEPPQILLLHDTWLEADHLNDLLALMRSRGYGFVSLDTALRDPAYAQPDDYISDVGASWIEHWAVTRGHFMPQTARPQLPDWVEKLHTAFDAAHPD